MELTIILSFPSASRFSLPFAERDLKAKLSAKFKVRFRVQTFQEGKGIG
jgi:hypothetical protein